MYCVLEQSVIPVCLTRAGAEIADETTTRVLNGEHVAVAVVGVLRYSSVGIRRSGPEPGSIVGIRGAPSSVVRSSRDLVARIIRELNLNSTVEAYSNGVSHHAKRLMDIGDFTRMVRCGAGGTR